METIKDNILIYEEGKIKYGTNIMGDLISLSLKDFSIDVNNPDRGVFDPKTFPKSGKYRLILERLK